MLAQAVYNGLTMPRYRDIPEHLQHAWAFPAQPTMAGDRVYGDGETWISWWVFDLADVAHIVDQVEDPRDLARVLAQCDEEYRGPGCGFRHAPYARVSRHRVLVTQYRGYDV